MRKALFGGALAAAAVTLLPVLVARGYKFVLESVNNGERYIIDVFEHSISGKRVCSGIAETISAAICNALIQVIRREKEQ